jgi:nucleoid DNA-binding protein
MELRIDKHIQQLLFNHNCVIIPSFGGFVGNYKGAEIHPTQHIFIAPCKQLVFNKNLTINDGLLANLIVQEEHVSYPEALEIIDKDVFKMKHLLSSGEKVELKAIGFLRLDVEKNIQFNPVSSTNYATVSYGLHSFQSSAIKRGGFVNEVSKTFKDRPAVKVKATNKKYRKYLVPALVLPIAVMLYLSPFSANIKDKIEIQTSGFLNKSEPILYEPHTSSFNLTAATIEPMKVIEESPTITPVLTTENSVTVAETTSVAQTTIHAISENSNHPYTLISGCFAVIENAEKQVAQLKLKNIDASIIGKTKNGLYRVGCGSYNSAEEANEAVMSLKEQQTEVWVLRN